MESVTYAVCHYHADVPQHLSTDRSHEEPPIADENFLSLKALWNKFKLAITEKNTIKIHFKDFSQ